MLTRLSVVDRRAWDEPTMLRFRRSPNSLRRIAAAALVTGLIGCGGGGGGSNPPVDQASWVKDWNRIAIDASGLDHTPPAPGETRVWGQQLGPGRSSRAIAIVQIAVFDAINAIRGGYQSYTGLTPGGSPEASVKAAVAQASHDTLVALFSGQTAHFDEELTYHLDKVTDSAAAKAAGIQVGAAAARAILAARANDGSEIPEPTVGVDFFPSDLPGYWRPDPISQKTVALGAFWAQVQPFTLESASQFRVPPPPAIESPEYAAAYDEAQRLGGDGVTTPTERTPDQTITGIFWAYDGTPSLCAPPRLYNQLAVHIAEEQGLGLQELARLLALANTAMADAGIGIWDSKYHYQYWRPVTGIREADPGTGPTGAGDGNPATAGDTTYSPLGAPASNDAGGNFTPPFPAYPSGHAGFGGALFHTLRTFFGTDDIPFTFVSDELNGVTTDNEGHVRPLVERSFANLSQAEEENGQSRIYLGIHWSFDKTTGITLGRQVAEWVATHAFQPLP